jgi:hypothetical protein
MGLIHIGALLARRKLCGGGGGLLPFIENTWVIHFTSRPKCPNLPKRQRGFFSRVDGTEQHLSVILTCPLASPQRVRRTDEW